MVRPIWRRAAGWALVVACGAAPTARAQYVRGVLRDSATREPIRGAVVVLTDSTGKLLSRVLADDAGKFALVRAPGGSGLHIVRIGYQPRDVKLGAGAESLTVAMRPIATTLTTVTASSRRVCSGEAGDQRALDLWEQARAGLLASVVTRETNPATVRLRSYNRTLEPIRKRVIDDTITIKDVTVDRSYVAARPAWAFASHGYMRESLGGEREYFAPDEEVLLDPSFASTHCLHVVEGKGPREHEVGIGFDPIEEKGRDTLVDVRGVLWLDRDHPALKALEFTYTNLERRADGSGGEIIFAQLPNGVPLIQKWSIHTMILAYDPEALPNGLYRRPPPRNARYDVRLLGYRETGGSVGMASWPDGTRWSADWPHVRGSLVDDKGNAVPNMLVWLYGTKDTVRTNDDGYFSLPHVYPGTYFVMASDSLLASQGISRTVGTTVRLAKPEDTIIRLQFYPRSAVLPLVCPQNSYKPGTGVLMAKVIDSTGKPVGGAKIEVAVRQAVVMGDTVQTVRTGAGEAGEDGRFVICGAALDQPIAVRATRGSETATILLEKWKEDVAVVTLSIKP